MVSEALLPKFAVLIGACPELMHVIVSGEDARGHRRFEDVLSDARLPKSNTAPTTPDDCASGSTPRARPAVQRARCTPREPDRHRRALCDAACSASRERRLLLGGEVVFRLWPRQRADLSVGGRRHRRADRRAADPGSVLPHPAQAPLDDLLRRADPLRRIAREPDAPSAGARLRTCVSAGEALPPDIGRRWSSASASTSSTASARPSAAHLSVEPVRRRAIRHHRQAGSRLRCWRSWMTTATSSAAAKSATCWCAGQPLRRGTGTTASSRATFDGAWTRTGDKYS